MRILIDAMGGDNAPQAVVSGAVAAAKEFGVDITLIGREEDIRSCLKAEGAENDGHISIVHATEVITMEDDPANATRRKKDSSMSVMLQMLAKGEGDACVSAGSTGALLSGATLTVKRIRGIRRACFAPVLPNGGHGAMIIDSGANVECTAEYLLQFAYMGSFYAREMMGCENPRVGLLNIGAEDTKGTQLQLETNRLLREAAEAGRLNFIGNVESSEFLGGKVDVLVCDGFSGNVLLKAVEGTARFLMKEVKKVFMKSTFNKLAALIVKKDVSALKAMMDVSEVGGTALLGLTKPVIKAHGSSDARAIRSAVRQAIACRESNIIESIEKNIGYMRLNTTQGE
ncbi:MAG: phosphate acyltransferase PlsX [Ruminococcaceae bacterium]|nr:phosphate acyltransferase PlsX [Oscillospiraceae bacterium]